MKNGVDFYTTGHAVVTVHFPEDKVILPVVPFCRNEDSLRRWKCLLTGEYLVYPFQSVGNECPVVLDVKEEPDGFKISPTDSR